MGIETIPFDIADQLHDDEALAIYLDEALQTGDPAYFAHALGKVPKARGMTRIAREAGLSRGRFMRRSAKTAIRRLRR